MVRFLIGDMFADDADTLAVPINLAGAMGAGVAAVIRAKYPDTYALYRDLVASGKLSRIDDLVLHRLPTGKRILLFPTKRHWKEGSDLRYIAAGLDKLVGLIDQFDIGKSIAFPALGCGHGGLDWTVVSAMMWARLNVLKDVDVRIFHSYSKK